MEMFKVIMSLDLTELTISSDMKHIILSHNSQIGFIQNLKRFFKIYFPVHYEI